MMIVQALVVALTAIVWVSMAHDDASETEPVEPAQTLYVMVLLPMTGSVRCKDSDRIGADLARSRIIKERILDPNRYNIEFVHLNDGCRGSEAFKAIFEDYITKSETVININDGLQYVAGVVGLICNDVCRSVGATFSILGRPIISIGCSTDFKSGVEDGKGYDDFTRVVASWDTLAWVTAQLFTANNWDHVAIIKCTDEDWRHFAQVLRWSFKRNDIEFIMNHIVPMDDEVGRNTSSYKECLEAMLELAASKPPYTIIMFLMYDAQLFTCLMAAHDANLATFHAFIGYGYSIDRTGIHWEFGVNILKSIQLGLLSINIHQPSDSYPYSPQWTENSTFATKPWDIFQNEFANHPLLADSEDKTPSIYAGLLYDAVLYWAHAVNKTLKSYANELVLEEVSRIGADPFIGATGLVHVSPERISRNCSYSVQIVTENLQYFTLYEDLTGNTELHELHVPAGIDLFWPGRMSFLEKPGSRNCTSKDRTHCPDNGLSREMIVIIVLGSLIGVIVFTFLIFFGLYNKLQHDSEMKAVTTWIVKWDDILKHSPEKMHEYPAAVQRVLANEVYRLAFGMNVRQQAFTEIGYYKGTIIRINLIKRKSVDHRDPITVNELKSMINLKHENLNGFVGICVDEPNVCVLTSYAKQGSLHDVLMDSEMELPFEFKLSFAIDISKGMEYFQNSVLVCHGHLTSTNCVVDKKWTCKITDYGMEEFRKVQKREQQEDANAQLWTAPELLRESVETRPLYGTQDGDIYSYGVILQELALRNVPFAYERKDNTVQDIVEKVAKAMRPPFRPKVQSGDCNENWRRLMVRCWHEDPNRRPTFNEITKDVLRMSKGLTLNIIDNMLKKLEKHTQRLEELVSERTKELNTEKKKVEALLHNILPKTVAESLVRRGYVEPEMFESVTIYFSDIVDFLKISQNSTAYEIVHLLNTIYSTFDEITDQYDVYKCETIRDVYMVASGLPVRNGERHAPEITTMAIHLLSTISSFEIPRVPNKVLQLRIGLHTGSVVAGVVGSKMPHYCLFGDTVNTASRMQSGGLSLRIHISSFTADLLESTGNFILENRGEREVKGKGTMTTFWVNGKIGFDMPMPNLSDAIPVEEHHFK